MDGFTVGTPPYYGDFFTPGTPYEGWSISVDGVRTDAFGTTYGTYHGPLTGGNISYGVVGSAVQTVWQGTYNGITIKQVTTLDTAALYFTLQVTLTNTDTIAHNNIYYLRTVDPDNDEVETGGSFATDNAIAYQRPDSLNATVVTAAGVTYTDAFLALGTADSNAKCFIYTTWPLDSTLTLDSIYTNPIATIALGTAYDMQGDELTGDNAIGLEFSIGHLAPVDSAADSVAGRTTSTYHPANSKTFSYFYAFSRPAIDSALATHTSTPLSSININLKPINIYPNPTTNNFSISGLNTGDNVQLYSIMGALINIGGANSNYSLSTVPSGTYIIVVKDAEGNVRKKQTISKL